MERVLVTGGANIGKAGVGTIVYKWGQEFESDKLVYDYLMQRGLPDKIFQDAIQAKGGKIYTMAEKNYKLINVIKWTTDIIRDHGYQCLHINTDTAYIAAAYIYAAKKAGIKRILVHSHCTQVDEDSKIKRTIKTLIHKLCIPYVKKNSEKYLACSKLAGVWMFGKKCVQSDHYKTIYNGVETKKYLFDSDIREKYRMEFGVEDCMVIGNIGRLSYQKNQDFLLHIFALYSKQHANSKLMIIGTGPLKNELIKKMDILGISRRIIMLQNRNDIPELLSMMDVMVMPSRFEGLPVTMVEAQMSSLPCVVSGEITREAEFTDKVSYITGWNPETWVAAIKKAEKLPRCTDEDKLLESKFNISYAAQELQNILIGD